MDTETSRVGKLLADQAEEITRLRQQVDELVKALNGVIAVADRDTLEFRFAKAAIAKVSAC